jgi:hypothetical protein
MCWVTRTELYTIHHRIHCCRIISSLHSTHLLLSAWLEVRGTGGAWNSDCGWLSCFRWYGEMWLPCKLLLITIGFQWSKQLHGCHISPPTRLVLWRDAATSKLFASLKSYGNQQQVWWSPHLAISSFDRMRRDTTMKLFVADYHRISMEQTTASWSTLSSSSLIWISKSLICIYKSLICMYVQYVPQMRPNETKCDYRITSLIF